MYPKKTNVRNGKVDLMRFIMAVLIALCHSTHLVGKDVCSFVGCSFAVEFFFLVSGFLMAKTVYTDIAKCQERTTVDFIKKKYLSFYPEVFVSWCIGLLFISISRNLTLPDIVKQAMNGFWDLFLLNMSGIYSAAVNGPTWYLSSLLIVSLILYPLLKKFSDKKILFPFIALLVVGYLYSAYGASVRSPSVWLKITMKGTARAFFELCLGITIYYIYEKIFKINFTKTGKIILTIIEWGSYAAVVAHMLFKNKTSHLGAYFFGSSEYDYFFIVILMIAITLSFSHKSIAADWFDNRLCWLLGKYSFPLYLSHYYFANYLGNFLPSGWSIAQQTIVYVFIAMLNAFLVMGISTYIRKHSSAIFGAIKRLMIKEEAVSSPASNR